jgi:hypothetical protein
MANSLPDFTQPAGDDRSRYGFPKAGGSADAPMATQGGGTGDGAPDPKTQQTQPGDGGFLSLTGPGWSPSSQQVADWATVAGSNQPYAAAYNRATGQQTPGDLVKMQADIAAARKRLGPVGATSADFVGSTANPTNLLTAVPYVGPGLAGAAQSAFKDYGAGKDWPTIRNDALIGGALGEASLGLVQPSVAKNIAARLTDVGGGATAGTLLGHGWGGEFTIPGMVGAGAALHKGAERVGEWTKDALDNPTTRRALQQLLYGGAMTAKPGSLPPVPGFGYMGN